MFYSRTSESQIETAEQIDKKNSQDAFVPSKSTRI